MSFTTAAQSAFAARFDAAGKPLWLLPIGDVDNDNSTADARAIALDANGNAFVGGCFGGSFELGDDHVGSIDFRDGYVAKLSPAGSPVWLTTLPGACVNAIAVDAAGHARVGGHYTGSPDFGTGPLPFNGLAAAFVAALDAAGKPIETRVFGVVGAVSSVSGIAAVDGGILVAGKFDGVLDITPHPLQSAGGTNLFVARLR
ncbi:MAG: hypothetical protein QM820_22960 [Minicystis sp.]